MAFDGITIANIRNELDSVLTGGRIAKIIQPEPDELILTIKNNSNQYRLLISAGASLPLVCLTADNKPAPMNAPNFCMLMRKHAAGGKITGFTQPGLERVLSMTIEHRDELGDLRSRRLVVELMGKYSNIIFLNEDDTIVDSIKRISFNISSVREVLPGRKYFIPDSQQKADPLTINEEDFLTTVCAKQLPLYKAIYTSLTGLSPLIAEEICHRASLGSDLPAGDLNAAAKTHLFHTFEGIMEDIRSGNFQPTLYFKDGVPFEYASIPLRSFGDMESKSFDSVSELIRSYYGEKERITRIRQRSADLRKIVKTAVEHSARTLSVQEKQMHDTEKKEKFRIYGELINTYGYGLEPGAKTLECINYYDNEPISIPLDPTLTPGENAVHYFDRYNKLKRTADALTDRIEETEKEIDQLDNISNALQIARDENDLSQIRQELVDYGFIRHKQTDSKRKKSVSKPLHYVSSDGFDIYVGKNNYQNEEVSFKMASGSDWWFHAKKMPGSHVIVKANGREVPDRTFEEAGALAAFYSSGKNAPKVEVDYTLKKNLRKPNGARPGFVVYYTNYSLMCIPDISGIREES